MSIYISSEGFQELCEELDLKFEEEMGDSHIYKAYDIEYIDLLGMGLLEEDELLYDVEMYVEDKGGTKKITDIEVRVRVITDIDDFDEDMAETKVKILVEGMVEENAM